MTSPARAPGLYGIHGIMSVFHLPEEGDRAWLIDTGMVGEPVLLLRLLLLRRRLGLGPESIEGILLTHGHIDYAGNLAELKEWTLAGVYGHPAEQRHIDGTCPYEGDEGDEGDESDGGAARWCGRLEASGRRAFHYRPARIDEPLGEGDELPIWGGLKGAPPAGPRRGPLRFLQREARSPLQGRPLRQLLFNHPPLAAHSYQPPRADAGLPAAGRGARSALDRPNHDDVLDGDLHKRRVRALCRRAL